MSSCSKCGAETKDNALFCVGCGQSLQIAKPEYYVLQSVNGEVWGPMGESAVKEWITQKRITSSASIAMTGDAGWVSILRSQFSQLVVDQMNVERLAASTCPRCGAGMVALAKSSQLGLWLIIIGVVLTPVFCIGTFLWVWGMILRHGIRGQTYLQCPRCKYSTSQY